MKKSVIFLIFLAASNALIYADTPPAPPQNTTTTDPQTQQTANQLFDQNASYQDFKRYDTIKLFNIPKRENDD